MKQIIGKKVYDTEKATLLAEYWNGLSTGDFCYVRERLYITDNGNFFMHGDGGPMSIYSERIGRNTTGISKIIPYDKDEAYEWLEEQNEYQIIELYFNDDIEEA